jgi:hypothetical protein
MGVLATYVFIGILATYAFIGAGAEASPLKVPRTTLIVVAVLYNFLRPKSLRGFINIRLSGLGEFNTFCVTLMSLVGLVAFFTITGVSATCLLGVAAGACTFLNAVFCVTVIGVFFFCIIKAALPLPAGRGAKRRKCRLPYGCVNVQSFLNYWL